MNEISACVKIKIKIVKQQRFGKYIYAIHAHYKIELLIAMDLPRAFLLLGILLLIVNCSNSNNSDESANDNDDNDDNDNELTGILLKLLMLY